MYWIAAMTMASAALSVPMILQALITILYPTRAQRLKAQELRRQSAFKPLYEGGRSEVNELAFSAVNYPLSIWDESNSVFGPLWLMITRCFRCERKVD
jgi:hypothetical protein